MKSNAMLTDTDIAQKIQQLLQVSDLKNTTNNIVINKLESQYGVDLSHKRGFIRYHVDKFLQSQYHLSEDFQLQLQPSSTNTNPSVDCYGLSSCVLSTQDDIDYVNDDHGGGGDYSLAHDNEGTIKLKGSHKQNKVKSKKVCESEKLCTLSPELQKFLGVPQLARTEVFKRFRKYVKDKNLRNPPDGNTINCDETLRTLLGVESINILQIKKALNKHMLSPVKLIRREKPRKQDGEDPSEADLDAKRPRKVYSGFLAPLPISDALIKFLGTGESALTRAAVIKRLWGYIKDKNLQDPSDKKMVICDEKLKELFNVDSFHGFLVSKLLTAHFVKT